MTRFILMLSLLFVCLLPALAQDGPVDATPEASANVTPVASVEAMPIAIFTAEPGTGSDVTVIVNNPPAETNDTSDSNGGTPPPVSANDPLAIVIIVVLALLLTAAMVFGGYITRFLATLVPPETAASIYQSGVRFGLQMALNEAAKTPTTMDDEFFITMAKQRGLDVVKHADGTYQVPYSPPITSAG